MGRIRYILPVLVLSCRFASAMNYFDYIVEDYPRAEAPNKSCVEVATEIGQRLHRIAGVEIWKSACTLETQTIYHFRITYKAEASLPVISTVTKLRFGKHGLYPDWKSCKSELDRQAALFQSETGLEPVVAYCAYRQDFGWSYPAMPQIESFGTPKARPIVLEDLLEGRIDDTTANAIVSAIEKRLTAEKYPFAKVALGKDMATIRELRILYYATEPRTFWFWTEMLFDSSAICIDHMASVQQALFDAGTKPIVTFCSVEGTDGRLNVFFGGASGFEFKTSPAPFQSLADCNAGKQALVDEMSSVYGWQVKASFCSGTKANDYRVTVVRTSDAEPVTPAAR